MPSSAGNRSTSSLTTTLPPPTCSTVIGATTSADTWEPTLSIPRCTYAGCSSEPSAPFCAPILQRMQGLTRSRGYLPTRSATSFATSSSSATRLHLTYILWRAMPTTPVCLCADRCITTILMRRRLTPTAMSICSATTIWSILSRSL